MTIYWLLPILVGLPMIVAYGLGWRNGQTALKRETRRGYRYWDS